MCTSCGCNTGRVKKHVPCPHAEANVIQSILSYGSPGALWTHTHAHSQCHTPSYRFQNNRKHMCVLKMQRLHHCADIRQGNVTLWQPWGELEFIERWLTEGLLNQVKKESYWDNSFIHCSPVQFIKTGDGVSVHNQKCRITRYQIHGDIKWKHWALRDASYQNVLVYRVKHSHTHTCSTLDCLICSENYQSLHFLDKKNQCEFMCRNHWKFTSDTNPVVLLPTTACL